VFIIQGDNGLRIPFTVQKKGVEDLTGASVTVAVKRGATLLTKTAIIVDAPNGKCEFVLSSSDLTMQGAYFFQWTATFPDGRILSDKKREFNVSEKLTGAPPTDGTGEPITVIVDGGEF
jgi:BppU N-terminal domain